MLNEIGYESIDDLFRHIPEQVKIQGELRYSGRNVRDGSSEKDERNRKEK